MSNSSVRLWLDDVRPAPEGWVHVFSVNGAIEVLEAHPVDMASLDHDLGTHAGNGGDGTALVDWMAEHEVWPSQGIRVHSYNPIGAKNMLRTIDRYSPYEVGFGATRGRFTI